MARVAATPPTSQRQRRLRVAGADIVSKAPERPGPAADIPPRGFYATQLVFDVNRGNSFAARKKSCKQIL